MTETISVKYIFLDIVGYSYNRSVEAQTDIINDLNAIVRQSIDSFKIKQDDLLLIPTGDGICIALLNIDRPYDIHIKIALNILEQLSGRNNRQTDEMRKFSVRIGLNENVDNLITDINGKRNIAGAGINYAQRIMSFADGGNVLVGPTVYATLSQREAYLKSFKGYPVILKHSIPMNIYQYIDASISYLNSNEPSALLTKPTSAKVIPKFSKLIAYLIGHIIKNKEFIYSHAEVGQNNYVLFLLMTFFAEDSVGYSERSKLSPSYASCFDDVAGGTLEERFDSLMSAPFKLVHGYATMFYDVEIRPHWGGFFYQPNEYFLPEGYPLGISEKGEAKLRKEWPHIVEELGI